MTNKNLSARDILQRAFPGIPERETENMVSIGEMCSYPSGTMLCKEDAIEDAFYILLDGKVEITKIINNDYKRLLKHLGPGDFFGEMGLIHNAPRAATVVTTMPTTVLSIHKKAFDSLLRNSDSVSLAIVKEVSKRLRENDEMAVEDLRLKAGELAAAYQRLAEEEFARREFLTTIAHELRTPLTAANGFLEIARNSSLEEETMRAALDTAARNVQQIISLVNDILFLQEVELVLPEMHPTSVGEVIVSAIEEVKPRLARGDIRLHLNIAPELPLVQGHFKSLERAVVMVLDNAIKFSPDGGDVTITVKREVTMSWLE